MGEFNPSLRSDEEPPPVFRISRERPWPPAIDLATVRETLIYMRDDARAVPGLENVAQSLDAAIRDVDAAEAKLTPVSYSPIMSRFLPTRLRTTS
jgi:hypothetical protein